MSLRSISAPLRSVCVVGVPTTTTISRGSIRPLVKVGTCPAPTYQVRYSSYPAEHVPPPAASPSSPAYKPDGTIPPRKKVTINTIRSMYRKKEPITMLTAHDFPSAQVAEAAGMDIILVGDSLAMVAMGMEDTSEIVVDDIILHCRSVARAAKAAFKVGDLPMGSYEASPEQAVKSAIRIIKEGRVQAVKLEGGKEMAPTVQRIVQAGIPVMSHIGLTPQRQNALGGFRVQGKSPASALRLLEDALAVQTAGASMVVVEAVPPAIGDLVTKRLHIPTIGIGAGNFCSGQVLVQVDMLGYFPPGRFLPKFVKQYGDLWSESMRAITQYRTEVKSREYPDAMHTYPISEEELREIEKAFGEKTGASAAAA
ncbi:hypothetical protein FQN54_001459 [Arachnomyces sp. PD_36]|nr:hypothetical protein FQN54_001459 [Arachnomyces sp. PD_36]